jgi:hypothetical protein
MTVKTFLNCTIISWRSGLVWNIEFVAFCFVGLLYVWIGCPSSFSSYYGDMVGRYWCPFGSRVRTYCLSRSSEQFDSSEQSSACSARFVSLTSLLTVKVKPSDVFTNIACVCLPRGSASSLSPAATFPHARSISSYLVFSMPLHLLSFLP